MLESDGRYGRLRWTGRDVGNVREHSETRRRRFSDLRSSSEVEGDSETIARRRRSRFEGRLRASIVRDRQRRRKGDRGERRRSPNGAGAEVGPAKDGCFCRDEWRFVAPRVLSSDFWGGAKVPTRGRRRRCGVTRQRVRVRRGRPLDSVDGRLGGAV